MKKYLSRKFIMALFILVMVTVLLCIGKIDASTYKDVLIWIGNGYLLVNVVNKRKNK